ncbi:hypothetical protein NDU88_005434 [Pleurodeles waltl]|uniref:Uncharacterized protein n=1 Tax=Pleurodeles waltl TaxID=8319 RepID=A0AAV7RN97_PLEWA|nr:hypothetical protein NDU88_005434 [Pleurodeles waltl]
MPSSGRISLDRVHQARSLSSLSEPQVLDCGGRSARLALTVLVLPLLDGTLWPGYGSNLWVKQVSSPHAQFFLHPNRQIAARSSRPHCLSCRLLVIAIPQHPTRLRWVVLA